MIKNVHLLVIILLLGSCSTTRKTATSPSNIEQNVRAHIAYLADDKLEGRRTGTAGEELAMNYIVNQFKAIGLSPKGTESYPQSFPVNDGKAMNDFTEFIINNSTLKMGDDYFVYPFSADKNIIASPALSLQEANNPWFLDLKDILEENKSNPHFDVSEYIRTTAKGMSDRGASAVIFYNSSEMQDQQVFDPKDRNETLTIPVFYVKKNASAKYFSDPSASMQVKLRTGIYTKSRTGHNVIGYIDNHASNTIILGAHYDHLGYGEDGNSMIRTGPPQIHNGADDNASGTAALIELARILKANGPSHNNYLFIAFSGEELGLFGSKYFTENPTIDLKSVNYMINMDMVGRLNDSTKVITIGGYGTSPAWSEIPNLYFSLPTSTSSSMASQLVVKFDSSGTGPSDHTSFYRKDIPVLFYFTGLHSDYHRPSDDADKINYGGEVMVISHIYKVISSLDNKPKLSFLKTREAQTSTSARFSVTMGIMPDYTYSGTGVRADGVSDGKPAQRAGLQAGDIILQLGDYPISSLENYMQALGKFKKGDSTKVKFKRGEEIKETTVVF